MEFLRQDEVDLVRDKQDIRANEAHCCWESRTCADMILKEVVVEQPSWQRFDENLIILPADADLLAHSPRFSGRVAVGGEGA